MPKPKHPALDTDTTLTERQRQGQLAEELALTYLHNQGLALLARNVRCRHGEIDLIMQAGECIVFVEVRLRSGQRFGGAAASITRHKQQRIIQAARFWLMRAGAHFAAHPMRFDCVLIHALTPPHLEWLPGAFDAE